MLKKTNYNSKDKYDLSIVKDKTLLLNTDEQGFSEILCPGDMFVFSIPLEYLHTIENTISSYNNNQKGKKSLTQDFVLKLLSLEKGEKYKDIK